MQRALLFVSVLVIASSAAATPRSDAFRRAASIAPTLTVVDEKGRTALALDAVAVHAIIRGHLARTVFELTNSGFEIGGHCTHPLSPFPVR